MTLEEIFKKYPNDKKGFYRQSMFDRLKNHRPDLDDKSILDGILKHWVEWLKGLKAWGNQESIDMGFIIPSFMIEDANANDWKLYEG